MIYDVSITLVVTKKSNQSNISINTPSIVKRNDAYSVFSEKLYVDAKIDELTNFIGG